MPRRIIDSVRYAELLEAEKQKARLLGLIEFLAVDMALNVDQGATPVRLKEWLQKIAKVVL